MVPPLETMGKNRNSEEEKNWGWRQTLPLGTLSQVFFLVFFSDLSPEIFAKNDIFEHLQETTLPRTLEASLTTFPVKNLKMTRLSTEKPMMAILTTENPKMTSLDAENSKMMRLTAESLRMMRLTVKNLKMTRLTAENLRMTKFPTENSRMTRLTTENSRMTSLDAENSRMMRLNAESLRMIRLTVENIKMTRLTAENLRMTRLTTAKTRMTRLTTEKPRTSHLEDNNVIISEWVQKFIIKAASDEDRQVNLVSSLFRMKSSQLQEMTLQRTLQVSPTSLPAENSGMTSLPSKKHKTRITNFGVFGGIL